MNNNTIKFGMVVLSLMLLLNIYFVSADNLNGIEDNSITLNVGEETGYITGFNYLNIKLLSIDQPLCKMAPCPKIVEILISNKYIQTTKPITYNLNEGEDINHDIANIKVSAVGEDSATFVILDAQNINDIIPEPKEPIQGELNCDDIPKPKCLGYYIAKVDQNNCPLLYACPDLDDIKCGNIKCPNVYWDDNEQECKCPLGGDIPEVVKNEPSNSNIPEPKEPIVSSVSTEKDKVIVSIGGATGRDCEEYLKECNSGNSVLCEKWETNCKEKNFTIETKEEVKIENNKIYVNEKEIIMPDKASTTAIDNSGIKEEVKIELKDDEKPIYEITGTKEAKILALFKTEMQVKTQIDAQTGIIEKTEKPWWSFLAKEE